MCQQYWTLETCGEKFGPFIVETTAEIKSDPSITVRDFTITNTLNVSGKNPVSFYVCFILRDIRYQRRLFVSLIKCSVNIFLLTGMIKLCFTFCKYLIIAVFCILYCLYDSPKHHVFHRRYSVFV